MEWQDLLRVPFKHGGETVEDGLDCRGQAVVIHQRLGHPHLDQAHYVALEKPTELGDLIASDPMKYGHPSHVATYVGDGMALTTSSRHGPSCWPIARLPHDEGYWRPRW